MNKSQHLLLNGLQLPKYNLFLYNKRPSLTAYLDQFKVLLCHLANKELSSLSSWYCSLSLSIQLGVGIDKREKATSFAQPSLLDNASATRFSTPF
jgi:hypothetical protein